MTARGIRPDGYTHAPGSDGITAYVAGFLFSTARNRVVLIRKNRPAWQAGLLNGVGGHIEPGETPFAAMRREFAEEAGLSLSDWFEFATVSGPRFRVHFFSAFTDMPQRVVAMTDETLVILALSQLHEASVIRNLRVLIPLALDESGIVKPVHFLDDKPQAG